MNIKIIKYLGIFLLIAVFSALTLRAEGVGGKKAEVLNRTFGEPANTHFNINLISTWLYNDARSDISQAGNSGFIYPKGSNRAVFYQSGFIWGGRVQGEIRVGGTAYRTGMLPGRVVNGVATSPDADDARIFRVRPDYATADLSTEVADGDGVSQDAVRAQYELDWNEWPATQGAPFEDVDGNGVYDPTVDIPGVPGSDQTIWHVCNDFDPGQTDFLYGSLPMGVEVQYTYWGYNTTGALGSTMFRKYIMINKNPDGLDFTDMYVSMWSDPDLGDASDDFVGCDTALSLGYVYNAGAYDAQYEYNPPAGGFDFFQGPIVDGLPTDEAIYKGAKIQGKRNLPMSAFYFFINSDAVYTDPRQGEYARGTLGFYNLFEGKISTTGAPFPVPEEAGGGTTKFCLAGDPIARTGWIDGMQHPPGDRRQGQVAGPFTMAYGDTQEIVVAQIAAGAIPGVDRLGALGMLKFFDLEAQLTYDNFFNVPTAPKAPIVDVTELDGEIILDWSLDRATVEETESLNSFGFAFQGYNVYQLPSASAVKEEAVRVATYDIIDFINKIEGLWFDASTGVVTRRVLQFGADTGIQRYISIKTDALKSNIPLLNGNRYYFAVTAYAFNPDPEAVPNQLENPISIITVVPQSTEPGNRIYSEYGEGNVATHSNGSANASIRWQVADPTKLTGHDYEVFFDEQHYYMDVDGKWKKTAFPDQIGKRGINDQSNTYLTGAILTSPTPGTADVTLTVMNVGTIDYNYVDGVLLKFPPSVVINSASNTSAGHVGQSIDYATNTIMFGDSSVSGYGGFHGGDSETLLINVGVPSLPLTIYYKIYDDGWAQSDPAYAAYDALGGGTVHGEGTVTITEMGYAFKTESHWNVKDVTANTVVIDDQTVIGGSGYYDGQDYGNFTAPTADGLQIWLENGSYALPLNLYNVRTPFSQSSGVRLREETLGDYTINDYSHSGWAANAWAVNTFITGDPFGTTSIDLLQQDYELRFTGTYVDANADIRYIAEGTGQKAVLAAFNSTAALANHPMNPNPGVAEPFWVRIPFEVWNVDTDTQVNLIMRDRLRSDASVTPFDAFRRDDRMYCWILNTPYDENAPVPDIHDATAMADLTWNLVFWECEWETGDVVDLIYANPIQLGVDTWTFTAPAAPTYDADLAVQDIQEELNVFPNPYYGVNSQEINKYQRFVTFTHLPQNATIRIFNLAGQLVRTIEKTEAGQFQRWDLMNQGGLPVASGLYIAYVDMPDLGTTKVLKVAIIQEQQILDRF